ncbi:MAG TPA: toll/interleukin-1 receptor domain-containing protein [Saprospiraceae bacterium]|nr:toll/interleukin-1 receptor domain-containing protein [Saprospiraceae bacterium]HMU05606.1 toll/interleukin-1 receptor domain-containing protein [Saprospiraceae bacterium]
MIERNPIVFISYSHDNREHQERVFNLSNKLRSEGIDCILDQYEDSPEEGWPRWMQKNIKNADFVLSVCTETYYNRVMGYEEKGKGHGVTWEGHLIYQELYHQGTLNKRFIPVIFSEGSNNVIPDPLKGSTFYNVDDEDQYDALYWRLRGVKKSKPRLGKLRELETKPRKTMFFTSLIDPELWDKAEWNGVAYIVSYEEGLSPYLVVIFKDLEAGVEIFKQWQKVISNHDPNNELRISLVEGEVPNKPQGYYAHFSQNIHNTMKRIMDEYEAPKMDMIITVTRIHRMPTDDFKNLIMFKESFGKNSKCFVVPGKVIEDPIKGRGF